MSELSSPQRIEATLSPSSHTLEGALSPARRTLSAQLEKGAYGVPTINGVPLVGDISLPQLGLRGIYCDRKENWDAQSDFIGKDGAVYIYSDFSTEEGSDGETINIPSIKIGDGVTPLIDRPFVAAQFADTVVTLVTESVITTLSDGRMIVSDTDRENWNKKITCVIDPDNDGNLILTY